jgi:hypothetical protein
MNVLCQNCCKGDARYVVVLMWEVLNIKGVYVLF